MIRALKVSVHCIKLSGNLADFSTTFVPTALPPGSPPGVPPAHIGRHHFFIHKMIKVLEVLVYYVKLSDNLTNFSTTFVPTGGSSGSAWT